jgi:ABC-type dipeptide/oligopeptide/nickel transport system permease component
VIRTLGTRTAGALVSITLASMLAFVLLRLVPGDPARQVLGQFATAEQIQSFRRDNGLAGSIVEQYWRFIGNFARGDWGTSFASGAPVRQLYSARAPATAELVLVAFAFAVACAVVVALVSTYRRRPWLDRGISTVTFIGMGTPPFWLGLLCLFAFFQQSHLLPGPDGRVAPNLAPVPVHTGFLTIDSLVAGRFDAFGSAVSHLVLPAFVLGFAMFAFLVRVLRASLLEVADEPFVAIAQAKGLSRWKAFVRHALPNAALPALTASGLVLGQLLTGSVLVEAVFDWPGIGGLVVHGIANKDYTVVQTFILISAALYVVVNLLVDVAAAFIDPRLSVRAPSRSEKRIATEPGERPLSNPSGR